MATSAAAVNRPKQEVAVEQKLQSLRTIYADGPELGQVALEKIMDELKGAVRLQQQASTAGRTGLRQGKVSELTMITKCAPGGAKRLRALLDTLGNNFQGADMVGSVHDMRFVFLDNDTKLLFATAYDGEWDPYIVDFSTKIPDALDALFSVLEGYPGMHSPAVGDWIANHQITAAAWYVANPNLTVEETRRLEKIGKAVDELLDKVA